MIDQFTTTFIDGKFVPDVPIALAEHSRVEIDIKTVAVATDEGKAGKDLIAYIRANPIRGGGLRFTRDELHEGR